jgi:chromosome segregation protein
MKLKSLQLHGFKSFADRTTLEFRDGVTAIIGSNGCGKSNIADAVRWVLGEQRASAVRGVRMEEVIFQGTSRRRPLNFAEVSLLFDNESGRVALPQSEIEVTRKVFREGGSDYSLNRAACRLRDVHDLLRDTGLGANAYSVIEAGMIESLLSDRADERRLVFEEAAGIGRYKDSRQAALRRLASAEADLARLNDLVAEVESKVRALSRQKKRAERHRELQASRLDLELAVARHEIGGIEEGLHDAERRGTELEEQRRSAATERATVEAVVEERRIQAADLGRERAAASSRVDKVRGELDAAEREVLLSDERRAHAEMRIAQLATERAAAEARSKELATEIDAAEAEIAERQSAVASAGARLAAHSAAAAALRADLTAERAASETAAARARDIARDLAVAEGERAAAEERGREARERQTEVAASVARLSEELKGLENQQVQLHRNLDDARGLAAASDAAHREAVDLVARRQRDERAAAEALRAAESALAGLTALVTAREAVESGYEGLNPAVSAVMAERERFGAVLGPVADFIPRKSGALGSTLAEGFLGPLVEALVVGDIEVARRIRDWFRADWTGGGTLMLVPLAAFGVKSGEELASALLAGIDVEVGDPLASPRAGIAAAGNAGDFVDGRGIIRLVARGEAPGILSRRDELETSRAERDHAIGERDARRKSADNATELLAKALELAGLAEQDAAQARAALLTATRDADDAERAAARARQELDEKAQSAAALDATAASAAVRLGTLDDRLRELAAAGTMSSTDDTGGRERLAVLETRWEEARDAESELRVQSAQAESSLRESERRLAIARQEAARSAERLASFQREDRDLHSNLESLAEIRRSAAARIEGLFASRDMESAQLAVIDSRLAELDSELAELGERGRIARRREAEATDQRHETQLQAADLRSRIERLRERLEIEFGRPWDELLRSAASLPAGDPESWKAELREAARQIEGIGPVNMLALEEHDEEARRLEFLSNQRSDLVKARDDLTTAIRQINRTAREVFVTTFEAVRENFQQVFQSLFEGGECNIWLADPDDPLESPVEIQASPKGKRTQRIHLLSGGERTLTALALLFALYLVKPSPFCVLDEVDAPLDEGNVERFIQLLRDFKRETQFIVITHHPRTMEAADWVYGVTMEEPGVSNIVGVEMLGAWSAENRVA